jgi:hypothetical protein
LWPLSFRVSSKPFSASLFSPVLDEWISYLIFIQLITAIIYGGAIFSLRICLQPPVTSVLVPNNGQTKDPGYNGSKHSPKLICS